MSISQLDNIHHKEHATVALVRDNGRRRFVFSRIFLFSFFFEIFFTHVLFSASFHKGELGNISFGSNSCSPYVMRCLSFCTVSRAFSNSNNLSPQHAGYRQEVLNNSFFDVDGWLQGANFILALSESPFTSELTWKAIWEKKVATVITILTAVEKVRIRHST